MLSALDKKIVSTQDVAPPYEDHFKAPLPRRRLMTAREFLNPAVGLASDHHLGLLNTNVDYSYEMERHVKFKVKVDVGDWIDEQGHDRPEIFMPPAHQVYVDQRKHIQARDRVWLARAGGNHDQNSVTPEGMEDSRVAGENVFQAIRIQFAGRRAIVCAHLHQVESDTMVTAPTQMAGSAHDRLATEGKDGAVFAKKSTRWITNGLDFDNSYADLSYAWDADIVGGHVHLLRFLRLYYKEQHDEETRKRKKDNADKRKLLGAGLWLHRTGGLERILVNTVVPEFRDVVHGVNAGASFDGFQKVETIMRGAAAEILQTAKDDFSLKNLVLFRNTDENLILGVGRLADIAGKLEPLVYGNLIPKGMKYISDAKTTEEVAEIFERAAQQSLGVVEEDPGVSFAKGLTLKNMKPKRLYGGWLNRRPAKTKTGATYGDVMVFGTGGYDGGAMYGAGYADTGEIFPVDWKMAREQVKDVLKLPEKPLTDADQLVDHITYWGGFRRETLYVIRGVMDRKGIPPNEVALKYAQPPKKEDMPVFDIATDGTVKVTTPDGRPMAGVDNDEIISPHRYLQELRQIDPRAAAAWDSVIAKDGRLKKLFEPEEEFQPVRVRPRARMPMRGAAAAAIPLEQTHAMA